MSEPSPSMTSQELTAYKHEVENLTFMKRQQWRITAYAIAILAWLLTNQKLASGPYGRHFLALLILSGCIVCFYFLFRIQCEISSARTLINEVKRKYFGNDAGTFGKLYKNTFCRDVVYPVVFAIIIFLTGAFVVFSYYAS
jgi:hypothetical protein